MFLEFLGELAPKLALFDTTHTNSLITSNNEALKQALKMKDTVSF